jgi:hypothetical protein
VQPRDDGNATASGNTTTAVCASREAHDEPTTVSGHGELANEMGFVEPDPLTLTLYPDTTHDHDIKEDRC